MCRFDFRKDACKRAGAGGTSKARACVAVDVDVFFSFLCRSIQQLWNGFTALLREQSSSIEWCWYDRIVDSGSCCELHASSM